MNKHPEYDIQCMIAEYLDFHPRHPLYCATVGGVRLTIGQATKMKKQGYRKGIPDILIFEPKFYPFTDSHGLFLEVKAPDGRPSPEQNEWKKRLESRGYKHHFVYSFDEARNIIDEYLR